MILVTGAAGHIGNVLVRELLRHGYEVRAMLLPGEDPTPLLGLSAERVEADISRPETLGAAFAGVRWVAHLASLVSIGEAADALMRQVNVEGTRHVLQAARQGGVERVLYVGSVHAFEAPAGGALAETQPLLTTGGSGYERTKAEATRLALAAATEQDVVIAAPGGVMGPYDYKRSEFGAQILGWATHPLWFSVPGGYDFSDVRDTASGLRLALERGQRGELYLLGGEVLNMTQLAGQVQRQAFGRERIVEIPLGVAEVAAQVSLALSHLQKGRAILTPYALQTLQSNYWVDSGKAERQLGYTRRPMPQTIRDTVAWWQANPHFGGGKR